MRKSLALVPLLVTALALGACSSSEPEPAATPTPTPTPTGVTVAQWADTVCVSLGELSTAVSSVTQGLSLELGSGDAGEQLKEQLREKAETVGTTADDLVSAIRTAPDTEEAKELSVTLQDAAEDVRSATQDTKDAAQAAADATTRAEFLDAAGTTLVAASAALAATETFATTVESAASVTGDTLSSAFADVDSCVTPTSTP